MEKLTWYAMRWRIETFHKILKTGCGQKHRNCRTAEEGPSWIAVFCILSWNLLDDHDESDGLITADCPDEDRGAVARQTNSQAPKANGIDWRSSPDISPKLLSWAAVLARKSSPPPGNMVMWRGLSRLTDIELGLLLGAKLVGN